MKEITGFILAGGKSSRLGINKALLELEGQKVIEIIYNKLKVIVDDVVISTNYPDDYKFLDAEKIVDIYKDVGPLGGIHACLSHSETELNFIISCDLPLISAGFIKGFLEKSRPKAITLLSNQNNIEFMCGVYNSSTLPIIDDIINSEESTGAGKNRKFSIWNYVHKAGYDLVKSESLPFYKPEMFFNLNTSEDYEKAKSLVEVNRTLII